ncbi:MAG TPA: MYXO-CTERM sorting domain-containing protein [Polyangia bacterium]|nr:MYXO-CTERM sorting domain-containing protein [Polyangia bacterium]
MSLSLGAVGVGASAPAFAEGVAAVPYINPVAHLKGMQHERVCDTSKTVHCNALRLINPDGTHSIKPLANGMPSGFGPSDLQKAYAINTAWGVGKTVAIVDLNGYPNAESDLAAYRTMYGLPACTVASGCLKIVGVGGANPPSGSDTTGWNGEAALDMDMVSAICPNCKIILILGSSSDQSSLDEAQATAVSLGADVASNSWSGTEDSSITSSETQYYKTPSQSIGIFSAAGDDGYDSGGKSPQYPSTSAYVTGVGGTALTVDASTTRGYTELPWGVDSKNGSTGSSCSKYITKPTYQSIIPTATCKFRAASDISALGDPETGVAVYEAGGGTSSGDITNWGVYGGTSAATPIVSAIYAMTGNAKVGPSFPYANTSAFWDVVGSSVNNNGSCTTALCISGVGWDGETGIGTPNGAALAALGGAMAAPDMAIGPDMATDPVDMAKEYDLAQPPVEGDDMAQAVGTGGNGGGTGTGGGTGSAGGTGQAGGTGTGGGNDGGCGCSLGGAQTGNGLLALPLLLGLLGLAIYRRRRA